MIYVMSDLHGCFDKYTQILDKISFSDKDTLYILGDVIDRGDDGIKILFDMMMRPNVIPIMGNHEMMAYTVLKKLNVEITEENYNEYLDEEMIQMFQEWMVNGGNTTVKAFLKLTTEEKESLLEYLEEFSLYEEVEISGKEYVLVHAGINNFDANKPLDEYLPEDFLFDKCNYDEIYYHNKFLVTGHTPTFSIKEESKGKILIENNHIAIDCGAVFGEKLGCICLDNLKTFYI